MLSVLLSCCGGGDADCCGAAPFVCCALCFAPCVCVQSADMNHELQSEAVDLIVSAIDKQRGNYEVRDREGTEGKGRGWRRSHMK